MVISNTIVIEREGNAMRRPCWHAEDIKAAIRKRGVTVSRLGRMNGLHESACRAALIRSQPRAEKVISEFLGVSLHELWPTRYDANGERRGPRHERDRLSRNRSGSHRLSDGDQ